jgi:HD-like signal output (HDOD) protein/GGDEF domain-containing protein
MHESTNALDRLAAKAGALYSLPAVAMKVLELTDNPKIDVAALKQCIENDPALTTKLLRVVNSSLFGLSREVCDLGQALAMMGIKPLKLLVLGFSLPPGLFEGLTTEILEWYWRHTLIKAVGARQISETVWRQPGDEAFIAGLLQDLGLLALVQQLGEPYVRFVEKVRAQERDLRALEVEALGFDHTALSARLLDQWGLPNVLIEAIHPNVGHGANVPAAPRQVGNASHDTRAGVGNDTRHHDDLRSRSPLAEIVRLAGLVADLLTEARAEVLDELLSESSPGLTPEQLDELIGVLKEKVDSLATVLSLRLPEGRDYRAVLVEAHARLAEVALEAAEDLMGGPSGGTDPVGGLADELASLSQALAQASRPIPESCHHAAAPPSVRRAAGPAPRAAAGACAVPARTALRDETDPGLLGHLAVAVNACRMAHRPLSLLLVEIDDFDDLLMHYGAAGCRRLRSLVEQACRQLDHPDTPPVAYNEAGFAIVLADCDRQPAVRLGGQLIERFAELVPGRSPGRPGLSIGVGVATVSVPSRSFPPGDLLAAAQRCLYASHASGGVVKSVEVY